MIRRISIATLFVIGAAILICFEAILSQFHKNSTLDIHLHDTYFVIAHFHVTVAIALLFLFVAAVYGLYPKIFKRQPGYWAGLVHFITSSAGALLTILPIPYEGSAGVPVRYYDLSAHSAFTEFMSRNTLITVIVMAVFVAQIVFLFNLVYSLFAGKKIG